MIYQESKYHGFKGREIRYLQRIERLKIDGLLALSATLATVARRGFHDFELFGIVWDVKPLQAFVRGLILNIRNAPRRKV